jgi:hypothetical protein
MEVDMEVVWTGQIGDEATGAGQDPTVFATKMAPLRH